jgi:hypothetical protein
MNPLSIRVSALLADIFQSQPQQQEEQQATVLKVDNPSGGLPLWVTINSWNEIRVQPGKTPRYYPAEALASLERDLRAYAAGSQSRGGRRGRGRPGYQRRPFHQREPAGQPGCPGPVEPGRGYRAHRQHRTGSSALNRGKVPGPILGYRPEFRFQI